MILKDKIKAWILCLIEERFWKNPDKLFVSIILDEEIDVYKAIKILKRSNIPTFSFV
jgi:hypothetical protein